LITFSSASHNATISAPFCAMTSLMWLFPCPLKPITHTPIRSFGPNTLRLAVGMTAALGGAVGACVVAHPAANPEATAAPDETFRNLLLDTLIVLLPLFRLPDTRQ
jgi:hypothetical protein